MIITCELGTQERVELNWSSLYQNQDYIKLTFLEPLPDRFELDKFVRITQKDKLIFEGYVSELGTHSLKLISYQEILKRIPITQLS